MLPKILIAIVFAAVAAYGALLSWGTVALGSVATRMVAVRENDAAGAAGLSQELNPWLSVPGLRSMAQQLDVQLAAGESLSRLQDSVEQSLRLTPAASADWLLLAQIRLAGGEPAAVVNQALEYSIVTGRYELAPMIGRVGLAVGIWSTLTPELQRQVIGELGHVGGRLSRRQVEALKVRIAALPERDRVDIAGRLRAQYGGQIPRWGKSLGIEVQASKP